MTYSPFCMAQIPVVIWTGNNRYQYMPVCAEQDHLYHCHGHCYHGDDTKLDFPESQNCLTVSQPIRQIKTFIHRFHSFTKVGEILIFIHSVKYW